METESTVTQTYLYITVSHKTAEEMAAQYGFNEEQKGYLAELLADETIPFGHRCFTALQAATDRS